MRDFTSQGLANTARPFSTVATVVQAHKDEQLFVTVAAAAEQRIQGSAQRLFNDLVA